MSQNEERVILIVSSCPEKSEFGTAFIIARDKKYTYLLTCAHVVEEIGKDDLKISGSSESVEVVCNGFASNKNKIDMALLRIADLFKKPSFERFTIGQEKSDIEVIGYSLFEDNTRNKRTLEGKLDKESKLDIDGQEYSFLDVLIQDNDFSKLVRGFSGSPLCNAHGEVLGVISHQKGKEGNKGHALCISNLALLYPDIDNILPGFTVNIKISREKIRKDEKKRKSRNSEDKSGEDEASANDVNAYWHRKLEDIKDFLVNPPPDIIRDGNFTGTIKELRKALREHDGMLKEPQLISVTGTLFPAALLNAGWWESICDKQKNIVWTDPLKQWLFKGFDEWAPSWDISWDFENRDSNAKPSYYIAQLTEGDEADSIAVIISPKLANEWREAFMRKGARYWGGFEVDITGMLGHKYHAQQEYNEKINLNIEASDYCIWLKDETEYKIDSNKQRDTSLYSGYLWQCLIPKALFENRDKFDPIKLTDVYIVWEHTNFAAKTALNYNLSSFEQKISQINKLHRKEGGLVLLQKSHGLFVPGEPVWSYSEFTEFLRR